MKNLEFTEIKNKLPELENYLKIKNIAFNKVYTRQEFQKLFSDYVPRSTLIGDLREIEILVMKAGADSEDIFITGSKHRIDSNPTHVSTFSKEYEWETMSFLQHLYPDFYMPFTVYDIWQQMLKKNQNDKRTSEDIKFLLESLRKDNMLIKEGNYYKIVPNWSIVYKHKWELKK